MRPRRTKCERCRLLDDLSWHLRQAVDELVTGKALDTGRWTALWAVPFAKFDDRPADCPLGAGDDGSLEAVRRCTWNLYVYLNQFVHEAPDEAEVRKSAGWICDACDLIPPQCRKAMTGRCPGWEADVQRLRAVVR